MVNGRSGTGEVGHPDGHTASSLDASAVDPWSRDVEETGADTSGHGDRPEVPETKTRRLGLRARATVAFGAISLALAGLLAIVAYEVTRTYLLDQRTRAATAQVYANARVERSLLRTAGPEANVVDLLPTTPGSVVIVHYQNDWFANTVGFGADSVPGSLLETVEDGSAGRQRIAIDGTTYLAVGVPIPAADAWYFELVALSELSDTLDTLATVLFVGALLTAVFGAVVGWFAAGRVLRPLREVAQTAEEVTEGRTERRLGGGDDPDLALLVRSFNGMVETLEARIEREARFAADVSHELRSPLAAMTSASEVARRNVDDPERVSDALDVLSDKTRSFAELVEDLLEMSRMESGTASFDMAPIGPERLARSITVNRTHHVEVVIDTSAPRIIVVDHRRVGQILANLLDNADRYAGGATRVVISGVDRTVRFAVEDDGPGVPEVERELVFERFARGSTIGADSSQGTGLGLALVAEHVRFMEGRAWVEEAPTGGARFVVELPTGGTL